MKQEIKIEIVVEIKIENQTNEIIKKILTQREWIKI